MRRKFFSALLLGACFAASTSTFTSCKDYDDDIQNLQTQIDALSKTVSEIQDKLKDGVALTGVESVTDGVRLTLSNGTTYTITNGKDGAQGEKGEKGDKGDTGAAGADGTNGTNGTDGKAGSVVTIGANGNWFIDGVDTGLPSRGEKGEDGKDGQDGKDGYTPDASGSYWKVDCTNPETPKLVEYASDGTATGKEQTINTSSNAVNAVWDTESGVLKLTNVKDGEGNAQTFEIGLSGDLRSLVFSPQLYYGGIEAMTANTIEYKAISGFSTTLSATGETYTTDANNSYLSSAVIANYHMNPSFFNYKKIKSISFVGGDMDYINVRSNDPLAALKPEASIKDLSAEDGVLKVKINMNVDKISEETGKVTVLATKVHFNSIEGEDTTVTSDYAALVKSTMRNFVIADTKTTTAASSACTTTPGTFHIYTTAAAAIAAAPEHALIYNVPDAYDLDTIVVAHYTRDNGTAEYEITPKNAEDYGLKFEYAASDYIAGSNATSESVHCYIFDGSHIKACMPNADGSAADPSKQNEASIGRMPLVRVTLKDVVNGKIAAVGYIKFEITKTAPVSPVNPPAKEITFDNFAGYELSCTGYSKSLTWAEVENQVLGALNNGNGMSKEEFARIYSLDYIYGTTCRPYEKDATGAWVVSTKTPDVNNVENSGNHETDVLTWNVNATDIYALVWNATDYKYETGKSMSSTVKYVSSQPNLNPDIYVTFKSGEIKAPSATLGNSNKISNNWYAKNSLANGFAEIHNNVEVVGQAGANCDFKNDILATFVGNKVSLDVNGSNSFDNSNLTYEFKFVIKDNAVQNGQSGTKYNLTVDNNGTELYADIVDVADSRQLVATLSTTSSDVDNNFIVYQENDYAKDLLNNANHKDMTNSFTATIGLFAVNGCGFALPITDYTFDVKYLRPLEATGNNSKTFTDAVDGGNQLKLEELVNFSDWRDMWDAVTYNTYYGIASIDPDFTNVTTNLNGANIEKDLLSDITSKIKLTKVNGGTYGAIKYENNGQVTSSFKIRVPLVVTYKWGKLRYDKNNKPLYVEITVASTISQE